MCQNNVSDNELSDFINKNINVFKQVSVSFKYIFDSYIINYNNKLGAGTFSNVYSANVDTK